MGCQCLLQRTSSVQFSSVTQLCLTLRDPMDCRLPGSSIYGIFQARVLEWGAIAFSTVNLEVGLNFLSNAVKTSPREGNGNPLQYSCLENPMDGGAW